MDLSVDLLDYEPEELEEGGNNQDRNSVGGEGACGEEEDAKKKQVEKEH